MIATNSMDGEIRYVHNILLKKPQRKTLLERPRSKWKYNTRMKIAPRYVSICRLG
jgi:hypothetical protein